VAGGGCHGCRTGGDAFGTVQGGFGGSVGENAVHGSDSDENAAIEIAYFFSQLELV